MNIENEVLDHAENEVRKRVENDELVDYILSLIQRLNEKS